jgi:ABC-type branched-subunit amino acid transport system ATPase component
VLEVGAHHLGSTSLLASVLGARRVATERAAVDAEVERAATAVGVDGLLGSRVSSLPYGLQKKVDLARALVGDTRLLLLDEPAAGLDTDEWHDLADVLRATITAASDSARPIGVLLVRRLADRLYALDAGTVIAHGKPGEVLAERRVIESYLGVPEVSAGAGP